MATLRARPAHLTPLLSPLRPDQRHGHHLEAVNSQPARHLDQQGGNRELPAVVIGGLGLLAAGVIARSLRCRRRIALVRLRPGEMVAASSAPIRNLESALAALTENAAVDWLDLSMRHLSQISDQTAWRDTTDTPRSRWVPMASTCT